MTSTEAGRSGMEELALRCEQAKPDVIRFSVATIQGRKGYSWGQAITDDEPTARLLCDLWNNRIQIAAALRAQLQNQGNPSTGKGVDK